MARRKRSPETVQVIGVPLGEILDLAPGLSRVDRRWLISWLAAREACDDNCEAARPSRRKIKAAARGSRKEPADGT